MKASHLARLTALEKERAGRPRLEITSAVLHDTRHGCARAWLSDGRELRGQAAEDAIHEQMERRRNGQGFGCWVLGRMDMDKMFGLVLEADEDEVGRDELALNELVEPPEEINSIDEPHAQLITEPTDYPTYEPTPPQQTVEASSPAAGDTEEPNVVPDTPEATEEPDETTEEPPFNAEEFFPPLWQGWRP